MTVKLNEPTVEEKLKALYSLKKVDEEIRKIEILRGELPLDIQDLEDELEGLNTRADRFKNEVTALDNQIAQKKNDMVDAQAKIKKYEAQQMKVRNNREFDSLSKEIEYQELDIELAKKRINQYTEEINSKQDGINKVRDAIADRNEALLQKKKELDEIISETKEREEELLRESAALEVKIDQRLLNAYKRLKTNSINSLSIVKVQRGACGGCFNQIPPQRLLDIAARKRVIDCEYCGRILVDEHIDAEESEEAVSND